MTLTLYEIHDELEAWSNTLDLAETEEERAEIQARISEYLRLGHSKVDRFCAFLAHMEAQEDLCRVEEKRIASKRRTIERVRERLERYAISTMEALQVRQLEGDTSNLLLRQKPTSVRVLDEEAIPLCYKRASTFPAEYLSGVLAALPLSASGEMSVLSIEKSEIAKAIKLGVDVPGATLAIGGNSLVRK